VDVDTEGVEEGDELDETLCEDLGGKNEDENNRKRLAAAHAAASTDAIDIEGCEGVNMYADARSPGSTK
jgi:adenylylsulfate kinase-like enzyme